MKHTVEHTLTPSFKCAPYADLQRTVPLDVIADEPMLFSADPIWAWAQGGPLTRAGLAAMTLCEPPEGFRWVIDTRSHMLMPGQYPSIPGWHCDAVPRAEYDGQPDLSKLRNDIIHQVVHASTHPDGVSNTEFITQPLCFDVDPKQVWASIHRQVPVMNGIRASQDGVIATFTMPTLHRSTPAKHRGWRWWMRASMYHNKPQNRIRRQVQVYTSAEGAGW